MLALCSVFMSSAAFAQDEAPTAPPAPAETAQGDDSDIIVTGIRASLENAQNIKRNADTVVDAITAQDIGALPDRSVTEALQRVPGVSINRFAGSNDPDHFSVEGSGVVIRGLSFVRSEFNGRDTFSTGVYGQAINFADVPADLLGSVEVYKNLTAEMIEGGLSGTVNLNSRRPFDNAGFHLGFNAEMNYSDFSERWSPVISFLASNTWDTGIGRIGLLGNISYSQLLSRADGIQVTNFQTRDGQYALAANSATASVFTCRNRLPGTTDTSQLPPTGAGARCNDAQPAGADGNADLLNDPFYAPIGGQFRSQDYNRERLGVAVAAQWESLDRRALLTLQYLRTEADQRWGEHTFEAAPDLAEYNTYPAGCRQNGNGPQTSTGGATTRAECRVNGSGQFFFTGNDRGNGYNPNPGATYANYEYDEDNVFESGFITLPGSGWRTANSGSAATRVPTGGIQHSLSRRQVDDENIVADYGLNFRFTPDDHWQFNFDAQHVEAEHNNLDVSVFGSTFADQEVDITGGIPRVVPHKPLTLSATWAAPNPNMAAQSDQEYFSDRRWTFWRAAMDHAEQSRGEEWAARADIAYNFNNDGFLRRIKFGARYADRDQTIRFTTYNWGAISEVWSGEAVFMDQAGSERTEFYNFENFFRGDTPGPVGAYYYSRDLIGGYRDAADFFKSLNDYWRNNNGATAANRWVPVYERAGVVPGTNYLPGDIQTVSERNWSAYLMLSFGSEEPVFGNVRLEGNIGVRYVNTRLDSGGAFAIPTAGQLGVTQPFDVRCAIQANPPGAPPGTPAGRPGGICNLGEAGYAELQAFAGNGVFTAINSTNDYDYFLPSLNLKFSLTDNLLLRFAASRALARPSLADVRNVFTPTFDANTAGLSIARGNPFLSPAIADQFDLTLEWYFARVGSLTGNVFYKRIKNFFFQNVIPLELTNNGITLEFDARGPDNAPNTGKVQGFEIAYQQTYDFLPGFLGGLGMSASYTFIDSSGVPNSLLNGGNPVNVPPNGISGNLPLEQLSRHNVNVAAFYERGPISIRAAYNWRSRFLLTAADVIFPYFPIFNDETGQLDASIFFSITPNLKIGVQGVNLTNEVTRTLQQFQPGGLIAPRSYFVNDRRFAFILRGNF